MSRASPDPKLSRGFYQDISRLREQHELEDFKVIINGEIFPCHSFMLASCSEFFRCLLKSEMKEKQEMKVEINNISSSIFQLILNTLYTGCELLTKENVLAVWSAVHQLQIQFLIEHCEDFIMDNVSLDTVESYKNLSEIFQSRKVCEYIFNFILKNFEELMDNELFFHLDFHYLQRLLKSDDLNVKTEDTLFYLILKWVNYDHTFANKLCAANDSKKVCFNTRQDIVSTQDIVEPKIEIISISEEDIDLFVGEDRNEKQNERKGYLIELLKSTRYYVATGACIAKLFKDKVIQSDVLVKDFFLEILSYKFCDYCLGHWPSAAIHRHCSDLEHVGVYYSAGRLSALSLKQDKWFSFRDLKKLKHSKLIVFKGKLYACSMDLANNEIHVLNGDRWEQVTVLKHTVQLLLAHEQSIYVFDSNQKVCIKFDPDTLPIQFEMIKNEIKNPEFALSFHNNILVFCSVDSEGLEQTAVHSWLTETNKWTRNDNLEFSSKNMTSFRDDRDTYILDSNGILLKLTNTEVIGFTFVAKLWSVRCNVRGAVLFRETLFIFGDSPDDVYELKRVPRVYSSLIVWGSTCNTSNFVHYVTPKCFLELEKPASS